MNTIKFLTLFFSLNSFALPLQSEKVFVKNVEQFINLMPVIGDPVARRPLTSLEVEVMSNGCTDAGDFRVDVRRVGTSQQVIHIVRVTPDFCRGIERKVTVNLSTQAASLMDTVETRFVNPILANIQRVY